MDSWEEATGDNMTLTAALSESFEVIAALAMQVVKQFSQVLDSGK